MTPIVELRGIIKDFPGIRALDSISLDLEPGRIHALVGENGAGKSTLIKILGGVYPAETFDGEILFQGLPVSFRSVRDAERHGIATIHQELRLVPPLTVAENMFLGDEPSRMGFIRSIGMTARAQQLVDSWNLGLDVRARVSDLSIADQQLVEIARALRTESRVLILDEPTSALAEGEAGRLFDILRTLRRRGTAILLVSHRLDEVFSIADRITVLRDGKNIATAPAENWSRESVVRAMVGRELREMFPVTGGPRQEKILRVADLSVEDPRREGTFWLRQVTFDLHACEILGIAGLVGSGRSELLRTIFGESTGVVRSGRIRIAGADVSIPSAASALRLGLALVPEDRAQSGLLLHLPVLENLALAHLSEFAQHGFIDDVRLGNVCVRVAQTVAIRASSFDQPVITLSGGNQQKTVVGKWMVKDPRILLLDEPTRGIDVGAKVEVYRLINELRARGLSLIVASSELPELLGICDRILVLRRGTVSGECTRADATQERIMELAA